MSTLKILLREDRTRFAPGDLIEGAAGWQLDHEPRAVQVRLFWLTRGKGTVDRQVIAVNPFASAKAEDTRTFQFQLPVSGPYSFSGKLISLIWALELVVNDNEAQHLEIVVAPGGREVLLSQASPAQAR